jgi:protein-L-isoaspartate(D-aspartate) O-methyltransferase
MIANFPYDDSFKFQREQLVDSLRRRKELEPAVLDKMVLIPRELFVNPAFINNAYEDSALPIPHKQTISQPFTVAYMTGLLNISAGDTILEIGTGSGYQACLLAMMGAKVYTIERIKELHEAACILFKNFGIDSIHCVLGDGTKGYTFKSPYDGIIVTAGAPKVPMKLVKQLKIGGTLVVPVGDQKTQKMHKITRVDEGNFKEEILDNFKFVPLIGEDGWKK